MFPTTAAILALALAAPAPPDAVRDARPAVERKFVGEWVEGGPCVGDITVRADGTYERRHYSPGNNTLSGTWKVRWDALPPTLVLTCDKADWKGFIGEAQEFEVARLDDGAMNWENGGKAAGHFARKGK